MNDFIAELQKKHERVRMELDEVKLQYGKVFTENEYLRDENAGHLLDIQNLEESIQRLREDLASESKFAHEYLGNWQEAKADKERLVVAGKALRDALAVGVEPVGDCPREIEEWDALIPKLSNAR